jgi:hypothetical protein
MLFVGSFRLRIFVKKMLCTILEIIHYPMLHPLHGMRRIAYDESLQYIKGKMTTAICVYTESDVLKIALRAVQIEGYFLEFGVYKGGTIRFLARQMGARVIHGFDSFKGLPDKWAGASMTERTFDLHGKLPKVPANVRLHKGLFHESLPKWLQENQGPMAMIHIDCNLYSSTKVILDLLGKSIVPGTVLVLDEYLNFPNWQQHEFRAFQEFVSANNVDYEYLAYSYQCVAVRINAIGGYPTPK